jgi:DegV family protein with EDD domain
MTQFVSDSSTLYNQKRALQKGFTSCPLRVNVNGESYRDLDDLSSTQLITKIKAGGVPSTSQPPIGEKLDAYNELSENDDVIDITMADGLSGTYQTGLMAKEIADRPEKIHVINSKTLCGPHRELVKKAIAMNKEGKSTQEIIDMIETSRETDISFLIPVDFSFLKRGGRVKGVEAGIGSLLKLIPVMKKTEDGKQLEKFTVARTMKKALASIVDEFKSHGVNSEYIIYISHAFNEDAALKAEAVLKEAFPTTKIVTYPLSPAFISQGGPGCMAIQAIKISEKA